jgi:hypothetical protein
MAVSLQTVRGILRRPSGFVTHELLDWCWVVGDELARILTPTR